MLYIALNLNGLFMQNFYMKSPFSFLLLAIFFAPLSLENSQYQKESRMRSLERANPGSFWLGSIILIKLNKIFKIIFKKKFLAVVIFPLTKICKIVTFWGKMTKDITVNIFSCILLLFLKQIYYIFDFSSL